MTLVQEARGNARENVAANLRLLRRVTNVKVEQLADALGISRQAVHNRMTNKNPTPIGSDEVAGLAVFFNVPVDVFYEPVETTLSRLVDLGVHVSVYVMGTRRYI